MKTARRISTCDRSSNNQSFHSRVVARQRKKRRRFWLVTVLLLLVSFAVAHAIGNDRTDAATAPLAAVGTTAPATAPAMKDASLAASDTMAPASSLSGSDTGASGTSLSGSDTGASGTSMAPAVDMAAVSGMDADADGTEDANKAADTNKAAVSDEAGTALPEGFVHVADLIPDIGIDMRYFGNDNFMGRPAEGYEANTAILTQMACEALARVQAALKADGLSLVIYDAYRPRRAVEDFVTWASDPIDQSTKATYYPNIEKSAILDGGYIAVKSSHSRGSTVDLSVIDAATGESLDMGCRFDWFGKEADPDWTGASTSQAANRRKLRLAMEREGFVISAIEWWHFRLRNEPFPKTTFDFPVR